MEGSCVAREGQSWDSRSGGSNLEPTPWPLPSTTWLAVGYCGCQETAQHQSTALGWEWPLWIPCLPPNAPPTALRHATGWCLLHILFSKLKSLVSGGERGRRWFQAPPLGAPSKVFLQGPGKASHSDVSSSPALPSMPTLDPPKTPDDSPTQHFHFLLLPRRLWTCCSCRKEAFSLEAGKAMRGGHGPWPEGLECSPGWEQAGGSLPGPPGQTLTWAGLCPNGQSPLAPIQADTQGGQPSIFKLEWCHSYLLMALEGPIFIHPFILSFNKSVLASWVPSNLYWIKKPRLGLCPQGAHSWQGGGCGWGGQIHQQKTQLDREALHLFLRSLHSLPEMFIPKCFLITTWPSLST